MALRSPTNKNPFLDIDDDVDDNTFINYRRQNLDNAERRLYEERNERLLDERRQIENRMLQSSNSAVRTIYETEKIGMSTAEELVRQGEQLKKVDRNLDDIDNTMKTTQKHLTSMKSMFSGIFNRIGKSNNTEATAQSIVSPDEQKPSALEKALNEVRDKAEIAHRNNHPALKNRVDTSGFGAAFDDEDGTFDSDTGRPQISRTKMVENKLDQDLNEISHGMGRLKMLAQGLGSELDDQLDLMNSIDNKVDKADQTIKFQTNQMNRLLKK